MMHVAEKNCRYNGLARAEVFFEQVFPKAYDAGSCINNDNGIADSEFDTGRIASNFKGVFARNRKTSPYASESNHKLIHFEFLSFLK